MRKQVCCLLLGAVLLLSACDNTQTETVDTTQNVNSLESDIARMHDTLLSESLLSILERAVVTNNASVLHESPLFPENSIATMETNTLFDINMFAGYKLNRVDSQASYSWVLTRYMLCTPFKSADDRVVITWTFDSNFKYMSFSISPSQKQVQTTVVTTTAARSTQIVSAETAVGAWEESSADTSETTSMTSESLVFILDPAASEYLEAQQTSILMSSDAAPYVATFRSESEESQYTFSTSADTTVTVETVDTYESSESESTEGTSDIFNFDVDMSVESTTGVLDTLSEYVDTTIPVPGVSDEYSDTTVPYVSEGGATY